MKRCRSPSLRSRHRRGCRPWPGALRWADIAVAAMSTGWNYGPGWEEPLLAAYGIAADPERMAFHRELWNET